MEEEKHINDDIIEKSQNKNVEKPKQSRKFNKLDLLKMAENQDVEAFYPQDIERENKSFATKYGDFYDDVKQPNKYIKEDW